MCDYYGYRRGNGRGIYRLSAGNDREAEPERLRRRIRERNRWGMPKWEGRTKRGRTGKFRIGKGRTAEGSSRKSRAEKRNMDGRKRKKQDVESEELEI